MIPIGILTGGRVRCLDTTLRSLSATELKGDQRLLIFDDSPYDPTGMRHNMRRYLDTDGPAFEEPVLPWHPTLDKARLRILRDRQRKLITPIGERTTAYRVGPVEPGKQAGVVRASHLAFAKLFEWFPEAPAAILLQDDVAFVKQWIGPLEDLVEVAEATNIGLISGLRVNRPLPEIGSGLARIHNSHWGTTAYELSDSATATCLAMPRFAFEKLKPWLLSEAEGPRKTQFDDYLAKQVRAEGMKVFLVAPYVCQHFGVESIVRPGLSFTARGPEGRIGFHCDKNVPFVFADEVLCFPGPGPVGA